MNHTKTILTLIVVLACNRLYAGSQGNVKQFINHKDWNFVENKGQIADAQIRYCGHQGGVYLYCKPGVISFVFTKTERELDQISEATCLGVSDIGVQNFEPLYRKPGQPALDRHIQSGGGQKISTSRADLVLVGSNMNAQIIASDQQEYYENYYTANTPEEGITNVHTYKTITYKSIYPNIDMVLHASPSSAKATAGENGMKYEFVVYPGGKVSDIQIDWRGIESIKRLKNLGMEYSCSLGKMNEGKPVSFQGLHNIGSDFTKTNNRIGFKIAHYDKTKTLVIDPTLVWGTYFGGEYDDGGSCVTVDQSDNVFIGGSTQSSTGIATNGAYQTQNDGSEDAFLAKFDSAGTIKWATYFGGSEDDGANGIVTDKYGNVYIVGSTSSSTRITTNGSYQTNYGGSLDAFLAKFSGSGTIQWATYYGGNNGDDGIAIAIDKSGYIYITGYTFSAYGIATSGAYQTSFTPTTGSDIFGSNIFLAKFNTSGNLIWSTYFGGGGGGTANTNTNVGTGLVTDSFGDVYIVGFTASISKVATNAAYQTAYGGDGDAFVAKFSSSCSLIWATYFGGAEIDEASGIAINDSGDIYISGYTGSSSGIATYGAYLTSYQGAASNRNYDAFLAKFSKTGNVEWATYLGGDNQTEGLNVAVSSVGYVYITGVTSSNVNIVTAGAYQSYFPGFSSGYLDMFNSQGKREWGTYIEGEGFATSAITDHSGNVYITGNTDGDSGIASRGVYQTHKAGGGDAFLMKFSKTPIYDAGIYSILNPKTTACADSQTITVQLHNYGFDELDSVRIALSINGKVEPVYHWIGKLLPDSTVAVNIGTYTFPNNHDSSSNIDGIHFGIGKDTIKSWTSYPNGFQDSVPANDTSISILKIFPSPLGGMFPAQTICENDSTRIGGPGESGYNYSWTSNPSGFTSSYSYPIVTPMDTTTYYEKITNVLGCSNTASVIITVNPAPSAVAGPDRAICIGDSTTIGDTASKIYSYKWTSKPVGFSSNIPDPIVSPTSTTVYDLLVTNLKTGCTNSAALSVAVNPLPTPNTGQFSYNICTGSHVKIGANAKPGLIYLWLSNPSGFHSGLANPVVDPLNNTVYSLSVTDTATGCTNKNSTNVFVRIAQAPVVDVGNDQSICAGTSAQIGSDSLPGDSYAWVSNPVGFISAKAKPMVIPLQTTSYSLTVTNTTGCTNFDSVTITVNPLPNPIAGKPQNICSGSVIRLGDSAKAGYTYSWTSNPLGFHSSQSDPINSPKITTDYHLKATITNTGCADSDSILITVLPRPNVSFDIKNINGFKYQFIAINPNYPAWQYHWNFGDSASSGMISDTAIGYSVSHTYMKNGKYNITLTVSLPGYCTEIDSDQIVINEQFSLNIFPNPFELQTDINYTLINPGHVKISLTDEIGKQIGTLLDKQLSQGEYDTYLDAALFKTRSAMYFVLFQLDDKLIVKKIIQLGSE